MIKKNYVLTHEHVKSFRADLILSGPANIQVFFSEKKIEK